MQQRQDPTIKQKLSPEEIAKNIENARQVMKDLINPPPPPQPNLGAPGAGGIPKLMEFINNMPAVKKPVGQVPPLPPAPPAAPPLPGIPPTPMTTP